MTVIEQLVKFRASKNIAEDLDKELLRKIGADVVDEFKMDRDSRADWENTIDKAMEIAKQAIQGSKTFPWENAANIKFPLMAQASIQFAARTYPELIQDGRVVEAFVAGEDPDGKRADRAKRISAYMSYQLLIENDDWESDTDKLLHMLPIVGTVFRKTYYDPIRNRPCSELCDPKDIVIHNSVKSVETARRVTHKLRLYTNDIVERINAGVYSDVDVKLFNDASPSSQDNKSDPQDKDKYHDILEQHRFLDLDDDGYQEPYIVTVHEKSGKVLRIVARWDDEGIKERPEGGLLCIEPVCYFTDYHFIPSPDGSFYSLGFGTLLLPINESVNSVFNMLLDAGTLTNLQSGFIGGGIRIQGGKLKLAPGEWKPVDVVGGNIRDFIFPLPVNEPSQTLLSLLQLLIQTGKDLSGVVDILPDDQQTQNVPATTIISLLDQRLKPLKAIFKRVYRAFKKEFQKLYRLNSLYLPDQQLYFNILNTQQAIAKSDFKEPDYDVKPIADPSMSSESQRIVKAQALRAALAEPGGQLLNPQEVMTRWVTELNVPNPGKLIVQPPPPKPSPDDIKTQLQFEELKQQAQKDAAEYQLKLAALQLKQEELKEKSEVNHAKALHLATQSKLDIAMAQRDDAHTMTNHFIKMLELSSNHDLTEKELQIKKESQNAKSTNGTGMASPPSNTQTS